MTVPMPDQLPSAQDRIAMGRAIPTTDDELMGHLAAAMSRILEPGPGPASTERIGKIAGRVAQFPNLDRITLTMSGYRIRAEATNYNPPPEAPLTVPTVATVPAVLGRFEVHAHPVEVIGIPVSLDLEALRVPIAWETDRTGDVWLTTPEDPIARSAQQATTGTVDRPEATFSAQVNIAAARAGIRSFILTEAAGSKVKIRDVDVNLSQQGDGFRVSALAKARYGILSAKVTAQATLQIDERNFTATLTGLQVRSSNPVVALVLAFVAKKITGYEGHTVDLNDLIKDSGLRFAALDVTIRGEDLRLSGRLA